MVERSEPQDHRIGLTGDGNLGGTLGVKVLGFPPVPDEDLPSTLMVETGPELEYLMAEADELQGGDD